MTDTIHSCSHICQRPECVEQRMSDDFDRLAREYGIAETAEARLCEVFYAAGYRMAAAVLADREARAISPTQAT